MNATAVKEIQCEPYLDQRPGTAGLRKKVRIFQQPHYLQTFLEAIFRTVRMPTGSTLIVGGDGRYLNREAIPVVAGLAAAHGVARIVTGVEGRLSTPAASHLIRARKAAGGLLLTASHNPGGPDGDFGVKFNTATGGQAPEQLTEAIFQNSQSVTSYRYVELPELPLDAVGVHQVGELELEVVDSTAQYAELMESLFDFDCIRDYLHAGHRVVFDALHAVTGPYAEEIFCRRLGAPAESLLHAEPLPDFGGFHPDPNPVDAAHLVELAHSGSPPDLCAASDGDGDRNMILGPGMMISPCDSIAVMLHHAARLPGYRHGVIGVARSMPTSRALDTVARAMDVPCFETPTGWRYFCNLLEAGRIELCGEESFGTGSAHTREKDGLWAVLFWLNLLAALRQPMNQIMRDHWQRYGRHFYQRRDFFVRDGERAQALIASLRNRLPDLSGGNFDGIGIGRADDFSYHDPVDGSESRHQGICFEFDDDTRIVYRLSGTGTEGATLRVYLESYHRALPSPSIAVEAAIRPVARRAMQLADVTGFTGLREPTAAI